MSVDLGKKRIIMIHGLASKPAPEITHALWRRAITENIRVSHGLLARSLDAHDDIFESAYWANFVPHHIPDDAAYAAMVGVLEARLRAQCVNGQRPGGGPCEETP